MDTRSPVTDLAPDVTFKGSTSRILFRLASAQFGVSNNEALRSEVNASIQGNIATEIPSEKIEALDTTLAGIKAEIAKLTATLAEAKTPAFIKTLVKPRLDAIIGEIQETTAARETLETVINQLEKQADERKRKIKEEFKTSTDPTTMKRDIEGQNKAIAETAKQMASAIQMFEKGAKKNMESYSALRSIIPPEAAIALPSVEKLSNLMRPQ